MPRSNEVVEGLIQEYADLLALSGRDPFRVRLLARVPGAAGKEDRAGRHRDDADVVLRELARERLGQADLSRLHRVVGHPSARFAPEDR